MGRYSTRTPSGGRKTPNRALRKNNDDQSQSPANTSNSVNWNTKSGVGTRSNTRPRTPNLRRSPRRLSAGVKFVKTPSSPVAPRSPIVAAKKNARNPGVWLDAPRNNAPFSAQQAKRTANGTRKPVVRKLDVDPTTPQTISSQPRVQSTQLSRQNCSYVPHNNALYGFNGDSAAEKVAPVYRYPAAKYDPVPRPKVTVDLPQQEEVDMSKVKFSSEMKFRHMTKEEQVLAKSPQVVFKPMKAKDGQGVNKEKEGNSETSGHTPFSRATGGSSTTSGPWTRASHANRIACVANASDPRFDGEVVKQWRAFNKEEIDARIEIARIDALRMSGHLENDYVRELRRLNLEKQREEEAQHGAGVEWADQ